MIFRRFYDDALAQASYMIGCERTGTAVVVDPNLAIETYVRAAERDGLEIRHVTETHIHADFASGARALAAATGAELHVSAEGGEGWQYAFAGEPGVSTLRDGDRLTVGAVALDAMHTPGHTPEHLTFIVTDGARSNAPVGALTGDFLFVGDVGRPDLLERAAGQAGTMHAAAAALYASVQRFKRLPDHLQIWPGHGAGSACGKSMSSAAQSTLGYERVANWALEPMSEHEFVKRVLEGQPPAPPYFGAMKMRNRDADAPRRTPLPRRLEANELAGLSDSSVFVLDVRNRDEWERGHMPHATLVPLPELHERLAEIPRDRPIVVHCQRGARSAAGAATLDAFRFDDVHELSGGFAAWEAGGNA
ncbi:MAG TPA: MBL fold metallo-hydrolase, partial [Candidatus Elarobacter sp.]|nr:MBL fold metallo-hydrolase [Candidatus Elarobacter sp.]